ncbi:MAG TPA: hypothetical protein VJU82_15130, partial [Acidobacteriaceae bacterium]|nr:hypothetical protein [Acidobacteriaceae bacterium]
MEHPERPAGKPNTIPEPAGAGQLLDLRRGWVADQNTAEVVKRPVGSRLRYRLKRDLKTIAAEARLLLDSMKQGFTKLTTRRFRDEDGERRKLGSAGAVLLLVVLAGLVGVGALVYSGAVQHIFDPEHAADAVAIAPPATPPQAQPTAAPQTTQ